MNYENQRTKFVLATNLLNSASSAIANRNVKNLVSSMEPATQAVGQDTELNSSDSMRVLIDSIDKRLAVINDLKFEGDSARIAPLSFIRLSWGFLRKRVQGQAAKAPSLIAPVPVHTCGAELRVQAHES